jgi:hypothetical protein
MKKLVTALCAASLALGIAEAAPKMTGQFLTLM